MTAAAPARALWIGTDPAVFAVAHTTPQDAATGVVLCSPFGWDDMASYPARRAWAEQLAADGFPAVRFDWPGTGDSSGAPGDPGRLDACTAALAQTVSWLRAETGVRRVVAVGIGFGGLVAGAALGRGAEIDDLVLWGTPARGRAFVRGERAFAKLQSADMGVAGLPALAPGWIESGGYVLSEQTLAELTALDLRAAPVGSLRRALLLDRDGLKVDAELAAHLRGAGVAVAVDEGPGYTAMVQSPERTVAPATVMATVAAWVRATDELPPARAPVEVEGTPTVRLGAVRERVRAIAAGGGELFAIVTEPVEGAAPGAPTLVLLPAWAERRCGPNRMWTEAARSAALSGVPCARIDLAGVGDATGDPGWLKDIANLHDPRTVADVRTALDALEADGLGPEFVVGGLCSGGYWSFQTEMADPRVRAGFVVNSGSLWRDPDRQVLHAARKAGRALQWRWWRRVIRGEVRLSSVLVILKAGLLVAWRRLASRLTREVGGAAVAPAEDGMRVLEDAFDALAARGAQLTLGFISENLFGRELRSSGLAARLDRWPLVRLEAVVSLDHNVRPVAAQRHVHALLAETLAQARRPGTTPELVP